MRLKVYPKSPAPRHISQAAEVLQSGGVIILPTDSVYSFACLATSLPGIQKLAELKGIPMDKARFSYVFADLAGLAGYSKPLSNDAFRLMNRLLPGPFTFILNANGNVNKIFPQKKTLGVRIPSNEVPLQLVKELGAPLLTTSIHDDDAILEYTTDPDLISDRWEKHVDLFVDGGYGHNEASTVLDCTGTEIILTRQGIGELQEVSE